VNGKNASSVVLKELRRDRVVAKLKAARRAT
jgi:hypothetical protein